MRDRAWLSDWLRLSSANWLLRERRKKMIRANRIADTPMAMRLKVIFASPESIIGKGRGEGKTLQRMLVLIIEMPPFEEIDRSIGGPAAQPAEE
jgi:hypothetical protein